MLLQLDCGLTRKIGEANYGSRGASINVELELDSALITDPTKIQDRIRRCAWERRNLDARPLPSLASP